MGNKLEAKGQLPDNKAARSAMADHITSVAADFQPSKPSEAPTNIAKGKAKAKAKAKSQPAKEARAMLSTFQLQDDPHSKKPHTRFGSLLF